MSAAPTPCPTSPADLLTGFREVRVRLTEAQCLYAHALQGCHHAKGTLERARAEAIVRGVEGKNEAMREAALRLELDAQHEAVAEREDELNEARFNLEAVRLEWDELRYSLRCLELIREGTK